MATQRWRIQLVEVVEPGPLVRWQAPEPAAPLEEREPPSGVIALLRALRRLARRGEGQAAWAAPLVDDPVAFLLDAMGDAVNVWNESGQLLFSNRAAAALQLGSPAGVGVTEVRKGERRFERRCLRLELAHAGYLVEVLREIRAGE
jgi:hypothetical protein